MTSIPKASKRPWTVPSTRTGRQPQNRQRGFSLMELLIVMSILAILASIAVPSYQKHLIKAREAVLAEDLYQMRQAIDQFFADNLRYPDNLEELISAKYLRKLPQDPFTRSDKTWQIKAPEATSAEETVRGSVFDVASGSNLIGLNSIPYRDW